MAEQEQLDARDTPLEWEMPEIIKNRNITPSIERIAEIARLEPDWDSYRAAPPADAAVDGAYELLLVLNRVYGPSLKAGIQPRHIAPLGDGGIQLEWKGTQSELEVQISPSGTSGYLLTQMRGTERSFEEADEVPLSKIIQLIVDVARHN